MKVKITQTSNYMPFNIMNVWSITQIVTHLDKKITE